MVAALHWLGPAGFLLRRSTIDYRCNYTEAMATRPKRPVRTPKKSGEAPPRAAKGKVRKAATAKSNGAATPARRGRPALVIVESPTKARTIGKYLGNGYDVKATVGHLRDLPTRELGVDVDQGFEPKYVTIKGKTKTLSELEESCQAGFCDLPRNRPGPRRRSDRLACGGPASVRRSHSPHSLPRDHEGSDSGGTAGARPDRRPESRGPTGPAHLGPPGGIQGQSDSLEEHQDGALGRPSPDCGAPSDRGA